MLDKVSGSDLSDVSGKQILSYLERAERLREERKAIAEDISEVFAEAKANGFDVKTLKLLLKERETEPEKLREAETMLDLYRDAIARAGGAK